MKKLSIAVLGLFLAMTTGRNGFSAQASSRDIVDLLDEKLIEVKTEGAGIRNLQVEVRKLTKENVVVQIPVGMVFFSNNAAKQNMVTTENRSLTLRDSQWVTISIPVACANISKGIPRSGDTFTIEKSPQRGELAQLMSVLRNANVPYPVRQAAIWIITDNASFSRLGILRSSRNGIGGSRVISEREVAQALKILDQAGIDIAGKQVWQDRETILLGLNDEGLKRWLRQKSGT